MEEAIEERRWAQGIIHFFSYKTIKIHSEKQKRTQIGLFQTLFLKNEKFLMR